MSFRNFAIESDDSDVETSSRFSRHANSKYGPGAGKDSKLSDDEDQELVFRKKQVRKDRRRPAPRDVRPTCAEHSDSEESVTDVKQRSFTTNNKEFRGPKSNAFIPRTTSLNDKFHDDEPKSHQSRPWAEKKSLHTHHNESGSTLKWNEAKRGSQTSAPGRSDDSSDRTDGHCFSSEDDREDLGENGEDFEMSSSNFSDEAPSSPQSDEAKGFRLARNSSEDDFVIESETAEAKKQEFNKYWEDAVDTNSEASIEIIETEPQPGVSGVNVPFVLRAHPKGERTDLVQCVIVRDKGSLQSKLYPTYELFLEEPKKKLIVATKMNLNRTSNYHLFDMTRGQAGRLSKKSGNYLGKLRAKNVHRTEYALVTHASERQEVAGIGFERFSLVQQLKEGSLPRKMSVLLPHLDSNKVPIANKVKENGDDSIVEHLGSTKAKTNKFLAFQSKDPVYENGNYRLNFNGRVSVPSVKNFQLVSSTNPDDIICQFGKIGEDRFHLDFKAPLNAFQAFALALSQFNL